MTLTVDLDSDVPHCLRTDPVKLRQILINLAGNAVKFTKTGTVSLRVTAVPQKDESLAVLHFEIADTGPGISEEDQKRLFQPFAQTSAGQQVNEGSGLGLAISRKFAQVMGGEIRVRSTPGLGSVFTAELPAEIADNAELSRPVPASRPVSLEPGQPSCRMLIVDDKADNRKLLAVLLKPFGFELREASEGKAAFDIWAEWDPHLIWMDARMPGVDGFELTRQIRANRGQTKIIIPSASVAGCRRG
jgi:anti-sigma regulatory factor (Ser/Thr protein kinase)